MAAPGWYNENLNRDYPFIYGTTDTLPEWIIADFGCIMGNAAGYVEGEHTVKLSKIRRFGSLVEIEFTSDAPGLADYVLVFRRNLDDSRYTTNYVNAVHVDDPGRSIIDCSMCSPESVNCEDVDPEEPCDGDPIWSGFLVTGDLDGLVDYLDDCSSSSAGAEPSVGCDDCSSFEFTLAGISCASLNRTATMVSTGNPDPVTWQELWEFGSNTLTCDGENYTLFITGDLGSGVTYRTPVAGWTQGDCNDMEFVSAVGTCTGWPETLEICCVASLSDCCAPTSVELDVARTSAVDSVTLNWLAETTHCDTALLYYWEILADDVIIDSGTALPGSGTTGNVENEHAVDETPVYTARIYCESVDGELLYGDPPPAEAVNCCQDGCEYDTATFTDSTGSCDCLDGAFDIVATSIVGIPACEGVVSFTFDCVGGVWTLTPSLGLTAELVSYAPGTIVYSITSPGGTGCGTDPGSATLTITGACLGEPDPECVPDDPPDPPVDPPIGSCSGTICEWDGNVPVEPSLVTNLSTGYVSNLTIANGERTRATAPDECRDYCWPFALQEHYIQCACVIGGIRLKEGYNTCISQDALENTITIDACLGGGAGQPCEDVLITEDEAPPDTRTTLDGALKCDEIVRSINGVGRRFFQILGGAGVAIRAVPEENKIIVDVNLKTLAICSDLREQSSVTMESSSIGPCDCGPVEE